MFFNDAKARRQLAEYNEKRRRGGYNGHTIIWACQKKGDIYTANVPYDKRGRNLNSPDWKKVPGKCQQLDCSKDWVYVVNKNQEIFRKPVDNSKGWEKTNGGLSCITVTDNGYIWGCNKKGEIFTARANAPANNMGWKKVPGGCRQLHASNTWLYVCNKKQEVFRKPTNTAKADWEKVEGKLKSVSVAESHVWGCNSKRQIFWTETYHRGDSMIWKSPRNSQWEDNDRRCVQLSASGRFVAMVKKDGTLMRKAVDNVTFGWDVIVGSGLKCIAIHNNDIIQSRL